MSKRRSGKKAILSGVISIILMVSMLGGTVFAESDTGGIAQTGETRSSSNSGDTASVDILEGDGSFEDGVIFNADSVETTGWNWMNQTDRKGLFEFGTENPSEAGGRYLRIQSDANNTEVTSSGVTRVCQPAVMWRNSPYAIEGDTTYTLEFYIRKNSNHNPRIIIQDRKDSDSLVEILRVDTNDKAAGVWEKVTAEFKTNADANRMRLIIYGNAYAEGLSFDIDGIVIREKVDGGDDNNGGDNTGDSSGDNTEGGTSEVDALAGRGDFEVNAAKEWAYWSTSDGHGSWIIDNVPSGSNYLKLECIGDGNGTVNREAGEDNVKLKLVNFSDISLTAGQTYILKAWVKQDSEEVPSIQINQVQTIDGTTKVLQNTYELKPAEKGVWEEVSQEVKIEENVTSFRMMLKKLNDDGGSNSFDNIRLMESAATLDSGDTDGDSNAVDVLAGRGDFEVNVTEEWAYWSTSDGHGSWTIENVPSGSNYLKLACIGDGDGTVNREVGEDNVKLKLVNFSDISLTAGKTYILKAWVKQDSEEVPSIQINQVQVVDGTTKVLQNTYELKPAETGTWEEVSQEVKIEENVSSFRMMLKKLNDDGGSISLDNIRLIEKAEDSGDNEGGSIGGDNTGDGSGDNTGDGSGDNTGDSALTIDALEGRGDFEVDATAEWAYWTDSDGHGSWTIETDNAPSNNKYLKLACIGNGDGKFESGEDTIKLKLVDFKQIPLTAGKTYILKAWVKQDSDEVPTIQINQVVTNSASASGTSVLQNNYILDPGARGVWKEVSQEVYIDENFQSFRMMLKKLKDDGGSNSFDNIRLLEPVAADSPAVLAEEWKAKLAAEDAVSMKVVVDDGDPKVSKDPLPNTVDNYLTNGDFTTNIDNWKPNSNSVATWSSGGALGTEDGCIKVQGTTTTVRPAVMQIVENIIGGSEYQISFDYKMDAACATTGEVPFVSLAYYVANPDPGDNGNLGQDNIFPTTSEIIYDGQWHTYTYRVRVPQRCDWLECFIRKTEGANVVYLDNVKLTMTNTATVIALNNNMKFFYTDMASTEFEASVQINNFPDYASGASVLFEVYDGQTKVWNSEQIALVDGTAKTTFDLTKLTRTDTPYCVKATLYDEGVAKDATSKDIFIYKRPAAINTEGEYVKFGESFDPVLGYHVFNNEKVAHYDEAKEAGINVIQLSYGQSAESVLAVLDTLNELGLKGMICLYTGMKPAGHADNIIGTIDVVSDERVQNHPALFGYNIMDEPFIHQLDPREDMENSYRLIRQFDQDNVIMFVEDIEKYISESSSFADALIMDPYESAAGAEIYQHVSTALDDINFEKPVWGLFSAFVHTDGHFNTADDARNNNYQALLAGIAGVGYFSVSDAGNIENEELQILPGWENLSWPTSEGYIPIWEVKTPANANAGVELWNGLVSFAETEKEIAYDYFVHNKGTKLSEEINLNDGYMYHAWTAEDGKDYLIVLNVKGDDVSVEVPVTGASAKVIAGRAATVPYAISSNKLALDLVNVEAILFEISDTPVPGVDKEEGGSTQTPTPDGGENTPTTTPGEEGTNSAASAEQSITAAPTGDSNHIYNWVLVLILAMVVFGAAGSIYRKK